MVELLDLSSIVLFVEQTFQQIVTGSMGRADVGCPGFANGGQVDRCHLCRFYHFFYVLKLNFILPTTSVQESITNSPASIKVIRRIGSNQLKQIAEMHNLNSDINTDCQKLTQYLQLGPLRVSHINFHKKTNQLQKSSTYARPPQKKRINDKEYEDNTRVATLRLHTEPFSQQLPSTAEQLEDIKVQLSRVYPTTSKSSYNGQLKNIIIERHLEQRAKEFVHLVALQKSKLEGRLFVLKHQEQERKSLHQQIEECERSLLKQHYQLQRRKAASQNVQQLLQRSRNRLKQSKSRKKVTFRNPKISKDARSPSRKREKQPQTRVNHAQMFRSKTRELEQSSPDDGRESRQLKQAQNNLQLLRKLMLREEDLLGRDWISY